MPTTPPTANEVCVDPGFAAGEATAQVCRPAHAQAQAHTHQAPGTTTAATETPAHTADWWGDAWALWNRHPHSEPQAGGQGADNLSLNTH
jgi:uncharacterized protein (DUF2235 family)